MDKKDMLREWNGRRYYSLDCYLKRTFRKKLYKLSLSGGMTCPNRDGTVSYGGCIFCSEGGSGEFAYGSTGSIDEQISKAKALVSDKADGHVYSARIRSPLEQAAAFSNDPGYIAYFQSFTNTYAPVGRLRELFMPIITRDDIDVLSIATRPDCLEDDKLKLIEELAGIKPVWIELGLQTIHERTARLINRGYALPCFDSAVKALKSIGADVIVHTIFGLPGESREDMLETAEYVGHSGADGIKLQLLHILKGTKLSGMYDSGEVTPLSMDEYVSVIAEAIGRLPPDIVIHRLTGDGDRRLLIAPLWSGDKRRVLNAINHRLREQDIIQGCFAK